MSYKIKCVRFLEKNHQKISAKFSKWHDSKNSITCLRFNDIIPNTVSIDKSCYLNELDQTLLLEFGLSFPFQRESCFV